MKEPIILIGPIGSGKSTIAEILAKKLSLPWYSLDAEAEKYAKPLGYKIRRWHALKGKDLFRAYAYRRNFYDDMVVQFLAAHTEGILDFGGGHPIVPDPQKQQTITKALRPYANTFLLMPTPDTEESLAILRKRNKLSDGEADLNTLYFKNGNRTFWDIAKHVVYTEGKTPEETCEEVISKIV